MKILIATDTYLPNINGAAYFTYRLAHMLAKRGNQVFVIAPSESYFEGVSADDGVTLCSVPSFPVPVYPNLKVSHPIFAARSIRKFMKEISPDIIHIQNHFMIGKVVVKVAKELGIPVGGTNHFMPENITHYFHLPKKLEKKLKDFGWKQFTNVFNELAFVTTPTYSAAALLDDVGLKLKVLPLSNGIDLKRFSPPSSIPKGRPKMLFVGRVDREKEIDVIIRAMPKILQEVELEFVLGGKGKERKNLEKLAVELGVEKNVKFAGFISDGDLPDFYKRGSLFVIAGQAELQSIATMEAMATGLPVVVADAMALPELCRDGENGFLFAPRDSDAFASAVIKIFTVPGLREKMSAKSLEIIQNHDINRVMEQFENLYKESINQQVNHYSNHQTAQNTHNSAYF